MIQEYAAFNAVVNGDGYYEPHMVKQIPDDNGGSGKEYQSGPSASAGIHENAGFWC